MKKRIKDLKLNDTIYRQNAGEVLEYKVVSISTDLLVFKAQHYSSKEEFKMKEEDLTRFQFEFSHWNHKCFLSRIDALKAAREYLDKKLEGIFSKQQKFLESIQEANNEIRSVDAEIAKELLNQ